MGTGDRYLDEKIKKIFEKVELMKQPRGAEKNGNKPDKEEKNATLWFYRIGP